MNSLESFKFFFKRKEPKQEVISTPLESIDEDEDESMRNDAASKRSQKLAGFFGVDNSKKDVDQMKQLLGPETASTRVTKRRSVVRKG